MNHVDETVSDRIVEVMNRAIEADYLTIQYLIEVRPRCLEVLASDPTIQVVGSEPDFRVGLLGLLSGIAGCHENGKAKIAAVYAVQCSTHGEASSGKVGLPCSVTGCPNTLEYGRLLRFTRTTPE